MMDDTEMRNAVAESYGADEAERFFARHAGYGYFRGSETPADGLRRTAVNLAIAERWAEDRGYSIRWEDDWTVGDHRAEYGEAYAEGEPETCEQAFLVDSDGREVGPSLSCIDGADANYRRTVNAELAAEGMGRFVRVITS